MSVRGPLWTSDLVPSAVPETDPRTALFKVQRPSSMNWSKVDTYRLNPYKTRSVISEHGAQSQLTPQPPAIWINLMCLWCIIHSNEQRLVVNSEQHRGTPTSRLPPAASYHSAAGLLLCCADPQCSHQTGLPMLQFLMLQWTNTLLPAK